MGVHDKEYYGSVKEILGIPDDEPIFIIRAQDLASVPTLKDYRRNASTAGADGSFQQGVLDAEGEFTTWQMNNSDKVKTPD